MVLKRESAEALALQALGWLVGREDLFPVFLNASGASMADLARAAQEPAFLVSVLDFVTTEDALVIAFCDATGHGYDQPMLARAVLSGGSDAHWT